MISMLLNIFSIIALGVIQVSFLTTWPKPVSSLNIILSLVIFFAIILNYKKSLWYAFGAGLFVELFSGYGFGITTLALILTVIIINFLFNNFFTNRSFYSLMILGFIATIIYNLLISITLFSLSIVGQSITGFEFSFFTQYLWQPFFNLVVLSIIFITYYFSTGKLKNIFLFPTH